MESQTNLSASLEDYLEAIFNLEVAGELHVARSRDIADVLGVSRSSVTGALRLLSERGLVNYKPYGFITLTERGSAVAEAIVKRHNVIELFFVDILGVDAEVARRAACKAEHALGSAVIERLVAFMEFVGDYERDGNSFVKEFKAFCEGIEEDKIASAEE